MFTPEQIQNMNELELEVYHYVSGHLRSVPYMRIRELASEAHVSTTTILRFCKKVDCNGYSELKFKIKEFLGRQSAVSLTDDSSEVRQFFQERLIAPAFQEQLEKASALIAKADTIIFFGIGNSLHIAQYAARCFTNVGKFSLCVTDPFYPTRLVPSISALAVVLSVSGESTQILEFARDLKNTHCPFISITADADNTLAKMSDMAISVGVKPQRRDNVDYTTQVPMLYLVETMARRMGNRLIEE